jgi:hypothetical protein
MTSCFGKYDGRNTIFGSNARRLSISYCFNIIQYLANPVVLGLPWFELHIPNID